MPPRAGSAWPARGGYLGDQFDAFKINDPQGPIPDITKRVPKKRFMQRVKDLDVLEEEFARGRLNQLDANKTLQSISTQAALAMMSSNHFA